MNNFALSSGVIYSSTNGYFEFYSSSIYNNYAISNPIGEVLEVINPSIISNSRIYNNNLISTKAFAAEILGTCHLLCFLTSEIKALIQQSLVSYSSIPSVKFAFQIISSDLSLVTNTVVFEQEYLINAFLSTISLKDVIIANITTLDSVLEFTSTKAQISGIT